MEATGETKVVSVDDVKETVEGQIESSVKPLVEQVTLAATSVVENVNTTSSDVGKEVEKLVPIVTDSLSSLKGLGEKFISKPEDILPTSHGEASEAAAKNVVCDEPVAETKEPECDAGVEENTRSITQPFIAVNASERASWKNCCGILDVFKSSHQ